MREYATYGAQSSIGDYAIAKKLSSDTSTSSAWVPPNQSTIVNYSGGNFGITSGLTVCHYGISSGYGVGTVQSSNTHVFYTDDPDGNDGWLIYQVASVTPTYGGSLSGDSGGPYVSYKNGEYYFCGIHSGSYKNTTTGATIKMFFTPYSLIRNRTGFTIH